MSDECPVLDSDSLDERSIRELLKKNNLALTVDEFLHIRNNILQRPPTIAECHLWSIQGSEHCSYKSSRIHLQELPTSAPNVILGPKEDAGVVAVAKDNNGIRYGIALSHESHNHPSEIVPYEGAATGVGGNIRDICCMGAEVISNADSLRFGSLTNIKTHKLCDGVVAGIAGYGNAVGIPNIAGDIYFDASYNSNCLVTITTLGIVREDDIIHSYVPENGEDYIFILVGKATDNSGFGGASFASLNLVDENHSNKGAIQEPNAFLKRHLLKANYALFAKLKTKNLLKSVGFKDLGAGGVACATVEMADAADFGAYIDVNKIPTSMHIPPYVALCSETQERFMWAVPASLVDTILEHYNNEYSLPSISYGARAAVIGKVTKAKDYVVIANGKEIINAKANSITKGIIYNRKTKPIPDIKAEIKIPKTSLTEMLLKILSHENIASRAPIIERYDKQVQGRTYIEAGRADSGILTPFNSPDYPEEIQKVAIALTSDQNPRYNLISPYWGAVNAVVEAVRNIVATGCLPQAITDCLCFGDPENEQTMWSFTECIRGIKDSANAIGLYEYKDAPLPVVAGNVSFYNETTEGKIPPSPIISCLGKIENYEKIISPNFQGPNNMILMVGARENAVGGSVYYQLNGELGSELPKPDLSKIAQELNATIKAIDEGLILSAHDIADGGIATTIAEMSFLQNIGAEINIDSSLPPEIVLFSENGGFVFEVAPQSLKAIQAIFKAHDVELFVIGKTLKENMLSLQNTINIEIDILKERYENGLREKLL